MDGGGWAKGGGVGMLEEGGEIVVFGGGWNVL